MAQLALTVAGLRPTAAERGHPSAADANRPPLRLGSGGSFKVALFADLHYGEDAWTDWGPAQDAGSDRVMAAVLDAEKPGPVPALLCSVSLDPAFCSALVYPYAARALAKSQFFPLKTEARKLLSFPDLVVYLGDLVTANNLPIPNASLYWDRAVSAARGRGIPWAAVFGNHDDMPFEWPPEWFSPDGVPPLRCPPTSMSASGKHE